jgi:hypothetical protein
MSLPFGLNADTVDFSRGVALIGISFRHDSYKAGIITFQYLLANYVRADIHDGSKFRGRRFCIFNHSRLCENGLDFVACGKDSAPAIQYYTALRLKVPERLLLFDAGLDIFLALEILEVETPAGQCQK